MTWIDRRTQCHSKCCWVSSARRAVHRWQDQGRQPRRLAPSGTLDNAGHLRGGQRRRAASESQLFIYFVWLHLPHGSRDKITLGISSMFNAIFKSKIIWVFINRNFDKNLCQHQDSNPRPSSSSRLTLRVSHPYSFFTSLWSTHLAQD